MLLIKNTECSGKYMCTRDYRLWIIWKVNTFSFFLSVSYIIFLKSEKMSSFWKLFFVVTCSLEIEFLKRRWVQSESMWPKRGFIKWSCLTIWGEGDQKFQKNGHVVYVWPLMIIIWWLILILCKLYSRLVYQAYQAASIYSFFGNWKSPKLTMHWLHA